MIEVAACLGIIRIGKAAAESLPAHMGAAEAAADAGATEPQP